MGVLETLLMLLGGVTLTIIITFVLMAVLNSLCCEHEWKFEGTNQNKTSLIFVCRKCNKNKAMKIKYEQFIKACRELEK